MNIPYEHFQFLSEEQQKIVLEAQRIECSVRGHCFRELYVWGNEYPIELICDCGASASVVPNK